MLNNALGQWRDEVSRLLAQAKVRNEAQHRAHHERANIHEQVSTQMHANLGQTTIEMRAPNATLEADLDRTKAEFTTYSTNVQGEHKVTRREVTRLIQQREVDGKEWGAYMAKAKERNYLLTRQIAQMADELKRTRREQAQPAETRTEASKGDERLHTLPSEGGGNGMGPPPRPPRVGGAPNPGDDDPDDDESYYRAPRPRGDPARRPMPNPYGPPEPPNAEQWAEVLGRTMARGSRRQAQPPPKFENKPTQDV